MEAQWSAGLPPSAADHWCEEACSVSQRAQPAAHPRKSLNISHRYAEHLAPGVREHLQNWRDQIYRLAQRIVGSSRSSFHPDQHLELISSPLPKAHRWAFVCKGNTLGWFVVQEDDRSTYRLLLCNYATVLPLDILTLGHSTKRDVDWMAGFFGEGVKVEINRLVASGAEVVYRTGHMKWTFGYEDQSRDRVLCVDQEPISPREPWSFAAHTLIELRHIPRQCFSPQDFVFLHPKSDELHCSDGLYILMDKAFSGKVFVQGIIVQTVEDPIGWGFDYRGKQAPPELKLGRDRNQIDVNHFLYGVHYAYDVKEVNERVWKMLDQLSSMIYDYLSLEDVQGRPIKYHHGLMAALKLKPNGIEVKEMADALLQIFKRRHGDNAIPAKAETPESCEAEAKLLGANLAIVSHNLYRWLKASPKCPTLSNFWQLRAEEVFALPEFVAESEPRPPYSCTLVPLKDQLAELALSLRSMVGTFFHPYVDGEQLRFKQFPPGGNYRRLIPLKWHTRQYFILNDRLIDPHQVHIALKKEDPSFSCPGGACGCIRDCIVNDLLVLLPTSKRASVERRIRRECLHHFKNIAIAPPSPQVAGPPERMIGMSATGPSRRSTSGGTPGSTEHRGAADRFLETEASIVQYSLQQTAQTTGTNLREPPPPEITTDCFLKKQEPISLRRLDIQPIMGLSVWVEETTHRHPLQQHPPRITIELQRFAKCIRLLVQCVFSLPLEHVNIMWEDTQRIAFNRGGSLFFNLRFAEVILAKSLPPLPMVDYWYPVVCHELAHNQFQAHGAEHSRATEVLVAARMQHFVLLREHIAKTYGSWQALDHEGATAS